MNAFSGIDPKYIDEAAFELHETPAQKRKAKSTGIRKSLFVVLPAAAAILLTVTALFTLNRSKNESASMAPAADSAAEAPAAESAAEEPAYEAEEPAFEAAEEATHSYDMKENAENIQSLAPASDMDNLGKSDRSEEFIGLTGASFENGILTLDLTETLPESIADLNYSITGKASDGSEKIFAEGILDDIIKDKDSLTLDITDLNLQQGTYTLSIGRESTEFEVK